MKHTLGCALAVAGLMSTVLAADNTTPATPRQLGEHMGMMTGNEDATSSNADRAFVAVFVSHARMARDISEYVAQKATNPDIKKLAEQVSTDQKEFSEKVQAAAKKEGITLQADRMLPRDQAILDFMKQLPVADLERTYVFHLAGANRTHLLQAQWVAKNSQKQEIKQAAQNIATTLETRDKTITDLAKMEVNTAPKTASDQP